MFGLPFSVIKAFRQWQGEMRTNRLVPARFAATISDHSYGAPKILAWDNATTVKIGKFCSIADEVTFILGGNHRVDWVSTYPFSVFASNWSAAKNIKGHPANKGDIVIGNDVWIAYGATILSGVTIGDGAVIGARAVVSSDIPAYGIAVGSPAKVIKYRFTPKQRRELLKLQWWNWPQVKIVRNLKLICSKNIDTFLNNYA